MRIRGLASRQVCFLLTLGFLVIAAFLLLGSCAVKETGSHRRTVLSWEQFEVEEAEVDRTSPTDFRIDFSFLYRGDTGSVYVRAYGLRDGATVSNYASRPVKIIHTGQVPARIKLSYPERTSVDFEKIRFELFTGRGKVLATSTLPAKFTRDESPETELQITDTRYSSDSSSLAMTADYSYDPPPSQPTETLKLRAVPLQDGQRLWRNFSTRRKYIEPGTGTVRFNLAYKTYDPQFDGPDTVATDQLMLEYDNTRWKILNREKTWHLRKLAQPSDTIPDDPDLNRIEITDVFFVSPTELRVEFDYTYRSDHGPKVYAYARVLRDSEDQTYSYSPTKINRGSHSASTTLGRTRSDVESLPVTDSLVIKMYPASTKTLVQDTVGYRINWQKEKVIPPSRSGKESNLPSFDTLKERLAAETSLYSLSAEDFTAYLERARLAREEAPYTWLLERIFRWHKQTGEWRERTFKRALKVLVSAVESSQFEKTRLRTELRRLFPELRLPLYRGFFDETIFQRSRKLFRVAGWTDQFHRLDVPNFWLYSLEHPERRVPSAQAKRPIFVHFPRDFHLESLYVSRDYSRLSGRNYDRAYGRAQFEQGYYRVNFYDRKESKNGQLNRFLTKDYSVNLGYSKPSWLRVYPANLKQSPVPHTVRVQAFPEPELPSDWTEDTENSPGFPLADVPRKSSIMRLARQVEREVITDKQFDLESMLGEMNQPGDQDALILRGVVKLHRQEFQQAASLLAQVDTPLSGRQVKWLQMYELLPVQDFSGTTAVTYWRSSRPQRKQMLKFLNQPSFGSRYSLARLYWLEGEYNRAYEIFKSLAEKLSPHQVLGPEVHLYLVSCLYHENYRQKARKHLRRLLVYDFSRGQTPRFYTEVEGVFTHGSPLLNYLRSWLEVMRRRKKNWWYEKIGQTDGVPHFRYFTSLFSDEPIGKLVARAFREYTGAEQAFINHKGMRGGLPPGQITRNQLNMVLPWNNTIHVLRGHEPDTGAESELKNIVEQLPSFSRPLRGNGPGAVIASGSISASAYRKRLRAREAGEATFPVVALPDFLFRIYYVDQPFAHREAEKTGREILEWYIRRKSGKIKLDPEF